MNTLYAHTQICFFCTALWKGQRRASDKLPGKNMYSSEFRTLIHNMSFFGIISKMQGEAE